MAFNKTIQMCIFDGNPNGKITCELSNWNGRVYKVSRKDINDFSSREDSEFTGVYFLLGKDDENKDTIYVGEAERMLTRIKQHFKDTRFRMMIYKAFRFDDMQFLAELMIYKAYALILLSCHLHKTKPEAIASGFVLISSIDSTDGTVQQRGTEQSSVTIWSEHVSDKFVIDDSLVQAGQS